MKAFVMKGIGRVGFADKPVPKPGPNDAIIKATRALIWRALWEGRNGGEFKKAEGSHAEARRALARLGREPRRPDSS